jgi:hypothetical protein
MASFIEGDWSSGVHSAFFGDVLSEQRSAFAPWDPVTWNRRARWPRAEPGSACYLRVTLAENDQVYTGRWNLYLCMDYGSAAPCVVYVCAISEGARGPNEVFYPRGSLLLIDELCTAEPGSLVRGMGYTISQLSEQIHELCARWEMDATGACDDACFSKHGHQAGSIAEEFSRYGVKLYPARKADRVTGWQMLRELMLNAGKPDVAGFYASTACSYFWQTVPFLSRDPRRIDDLDPRGGPDHAADAARYALLRDDRGRVILNTSLHSVLG